MSDLTSKKSAPDIRRLKRDIVFQERLRDTEFEFHSTWGLFSPRQIDEGTRLLVENFDVRPDHTTLEIGCGYGPIGIVLAHQSSSGNVHMVDKDYIAIEYAKINVRVNGLDNCRVYLSNAFSDVPERLRFDNIVSNLPAKSERRCCRLFSTTLSTGYTQADGFASSPSPDSDSGLNEI